MHSNATNISGRGLLLSSGTDVYQAWVSPTVQEHDLQWNIVSDSLPRLCCHHGWQSTKFYSDVLFGSQVLLSSKKGRVTELVRCSDTFISQDLFVM